MSNYLRDTYAQEGRKNSVEEEEDVTKLVTEMPFSKQIIATLTEGRKSHSVISLIFTIWP